MAESEGVIRYQLDYLPGNLPPKLDLSDLLLWFGRCRALGLIGQDPERYDGFAYGNISIRADVGFVISGTQTGGNPGLSPRDLAWVQDFDPAQNRLKATGPARPSSEAMTHGQIYRASLAANAVIHAHSGLIWRQAQKLRLALTSPEVGYGTPEMAAEVERLLVSAPGDGGVFAMGGHEDGVVAYAANMDTAGRLMLDLLGRAG
jgi:ribulose-5-phosphate 4-epimerase/fuculose-1-phosphate aldolase